MMFLYKRPYWMMAAILLLLTPLPGLAHKPSDSYLSLDLNGDVLSGRWDIALRDLQTALGIDSNNDGAITWGELKARHQDIANYALSRLKVRTDTGTCRITPLKQLVDHHSDGAYSVLMFTLGCAMAPSLTLDYRLFFDLDPSHRGLVRINTPTDVQTAILAPDQPSIDLKFGKRGFWEQFSEYWREGVWHIWTGVDHLLFLVTLLLPAVLWRDGGHWQPVHTFRSALLNVLGIVTAFTLAHSITLSLATLNWVALPSRWVESAIAATVVLAALNNLIPLVRGRRWVIAFCLGLIHGFGFASVLVDLGLPDNTLMLALFAFNVGVETGQLTIVAAFLPMAFMLRGTWFYHSATLKAGSVAIAAIASVWLLERGMNLELGFL